MSSFKNTDGDQNTEPRVDASGVLPVMDKEHFDTHRGRMWQISEARASVGTGGVFYLIRTGAKELHLSLGAKVIGQGVIVTTFEDSEVSADGAAVVPVNLNRRMARAGLVTPLESEFFFGPTVTDNGDQLDTDSAPAGATGGSGGGQISNTYQFVLAPNLNHLVKIGTTSGTGTAYTNMRFYEVAL
jgi:hypothetical protein